MMLSKNIKQTSYFLLLYLAIRLFSFFFGPATPLQPQNWLNTGLALAVLVVTAYLLLKKDIRGWYVVAGEIVLGGAGGFLSVGPLSLRTSLLFTSLSIFAFQNRQKFFSSPIKIRRLFGIKQLVIFLLLLAAGISAVNGFINGHPLAQIFSDFVPYLFLLYFYPLRALVTSEHATKFYSFAWNTLTAAIIGNAVFVCFTLFGFSSGLFHMQDAYYHWFRDVALGKITDLGFHFYRLVLNEHLLLIPVLLLLLFKVIKKNDRYLNILICANILILSLNLTRIYMVALAIGALMLFSKTNWKRWLAYSAGTAITFVLFFSSVHFIARQGKSFGWELFGLRLQSIVTPQIEDSSLSRVLLLPKIWEKIQTHPWRGQGLGDSIAVFSPTLQKDVVTTHFDWGYLEIWAEMGLAGLLAWIIFLYFAFKSAKKSQHLPMLAALLVINITSPALFHVMGIMVLTWIMTNYGSDQNAGLTRAAS